MKELLVPASAETGNDPGAYPSEGGAVPGDVVALSVSAYSAHAGEYEAANAAAVGEKVDAFIASLPAGVFVLDAGCGPGRDLARFAEAGVRAVGVDLNADFVQRAAQVGQVHLADLRDLPFEDGVFGGVWACASLVHLPPDGAAAALAEFFRVAATGARVCVSVKVGGPSGWVDTQHGRRWFHVWAVDDFVQAVAEAGFVVDDVQAGALFVDVTAHVPR